MWERGRETERESEELRKKLLRLVWYALNMNQFIDKQKEPRTGMNDSLEKCQD